MEPLIRPATAADAAAIAAIYAPFVLNTPVSFEIEPPDAAEMARRLAKIQQTHSWLVAEVEGELAGYAYGSFHRERYAYQWSADSTVYVAPGYRRHGVARMLYGRLFDIMHRQGFYNVFAGITLPNEASVGFHQSMGFELVGVYKKVGYKCGAWHDTAWWRLELSPAEGEPAQILEGSSLEPGV